jgi:hypothetical protein
VPIGHWLPFSVQRPFYWLPFSVVSTEKKARYNHGTRINKGFLKVAYLMPISMSTDDSRVPDVGGFVVGSVIGLVMG